MMKIGKRMIAFVQVAAMVCCMVLSGVPVQQAKAAGQEAQKLTGRQVLNFNTDWGFYRGDPEGAEASDYDDSAFANVTLPHTMRLEKKHCNGGGGSYKGIGWYRRYFTLGQEYSGKKINIDFEGVMIDSDIYLNGEKLYTRNGGYIGFSVDITDKVKLGETNVLAVRVSSEDNSDTPPGRPESNLDFHYYGGIYRDVTMRITEGLYISDAVQAEKTAGGGVFVTYPEVAEETAKVQVKTHVVNEAEESAVTTVEQVLKDIDGTVVGTVKSSEQNVAAGADQEFSQELTVSNPKLWHPEHPDLYDLATTVYRNGEAVDTVSNRIGIRTIDYKSDGFYINGERLYLRGANRHQAFQHIGDAGSNSMQYRDAILMKENGFNAVRAAHYPQDPAFLQACDELGLVVVECQPGWQNFTNTQTFYDRTIRDTREMVRRDRNHPSVILWETSLNESWTSEQWVIDATAAGHDEYPGDQFFTANDYGFYGARYDVCYKVQDTGWNSDSSKWTDFDPEKPFFTREWGDFEGSSKALRKEGMSAQNEQILTRQRYLNGDGYSDWGGLDASDRIGGYFLWSFNDYTRGSNSKTLGSGTVDVDRYEKNCYYWLKSMQPAENPVYGPMVFISSDYTEQSDREVMVFSNCDSVKLYQNGELAEEMQREEALKAVPNIAKKDGSPIFTFHLDNFQAGTLRAEGILNEEAAVAHEVRTPEAAARFEIEVKDRGIQPVADGSDLIPVYIKAVDQNGTVVPDFNGEVHISVSGEGELVGRDIPRIKAEDQQLEAGIGFAFVRTAKNAGSITVTASAQGMADTSEKVETKPYTGACVPEGTHTAWEGGVEKLEEKQLENIAAGKPVKVSSQQPGNEGANGADEDESSRWCANGGAFPQWLEIDLGKKCALSGFQILWEKGDVITQYMIQVSDDGETWETAVDRLQNGKANGSTETQMAKTQGRYVKINIQGMNEGWASFYEFRVFPDEEQDEVDPGEVIPDEMISSITATGGEAEGRGTDKLRDGVTEIGSGWLSVSREFPQSVTLEFSEPQNLLGNRIYWEKDSSWYTYDLELSEDGKTWEKVIDSVTVGGQHYKAETFPQMKKNIRYARITIQNIVAGGEFNIGMAEWILYGSPAVKGPVKEFDYASDLEWESADTDYGSVQKDQAAYGGKQALHSEYGDLEFEKGLGTDTNSEIVYNVEEKKYTAFASFIGINANAGKQGGEAVFKIYKDDELIYTSPVKMRNDNCDFVSVDITGAKKVRLVTEWNDNPENSEARYNTHTNWSNARFYGVSKSRVQLRQIYDTELLQNRQAGQYTMASFTGYQKAMEDIPESLADPALDDLQIGNLTKELQTAVSSLRRLSELTPEELLEEILAQAEVIRKQAEEAQSKAEEAQSKAEEAKADAEEAQAKAEEAKRLADQARQEAEEIRKQTGEDSEAAKQAMKEAKERAEEAKRAEEAAKASELAAKASEEAAKASLEAALKVQEAAEAAKKEAEAEAEEAKKAKEEAEKAKEEAIKAQEEAKKAREAAEAARKEAEVKAKKAEEDRLLAQKLLEEMRIEKEAAERAREEAQKVRDDLDVRYGKKTETRVAKVTLRSVKSAKKNQVKVTWKKISSVSGYEIQYGTSSKFKQAVKKKIRKNTGSITIKKLKPRKKYYVRVRAYKNVNGSVVYGSYSKRGTVKVK